MKTPSEPIEIIKYSGERGLFSIDKLKDSLRKSGADETVVNEIAGQVRDELYEGISTKEIYNRAFALLKKEKNSYASKYKLKKALYELGPTGFPFEKFVGSLLRYCGYSVQIGHMLKGKCVTHEVDVIARKGQQHIVAECKFHATEGRNCNVKIPLYIHSRYQDILEFYGENDNPEKPNEGWVVTNTRFTADALQFGKCIGLYLLGWNYPKNHGLKDRIDQFGLYPITVSTLLTHREKQFLLSRDVIMCKQLIGDDFYLDHLGISDNRKKRIMKEINELCLV